MDSVAFEKQAETPPPRKWSDRTWCMLVKPTYFFKFRGEKLSFLKFNVVLLKQHSSKIPLKLTTWHCEQWMKTVRY